MVSSLFAIGKSMKHAVWICVIGAGLAGWWLLHSDADTRQTDGVAGTVSGLNPIENSESSSGIAGFETTLGSSDSGNSANSLRQDKPASFTSTTDYESAAALKIIEAIETNDIDQAVESIEEVTHCKNAALSTAQLQERSRSVEQALSDASVRKLPKAAAESIASNLERLAEDCSRFYSEGSELLEGSIRDQAVRGNPVARFIYAMWDFGDQASTILGQEALLNYESQAMEFTQANLNEGHELGLLAMGLSLARGSHFTTQRTSLSAAYLMASQLCGIDNKVVSRPLSMYFSRKESPNARLVETLASDELVNSVALNLYEKFCAKSGR
jgi:hypothetical protein